MKTMGSSLSEFTNLTHLFQDLKKKNYLFLAHLFPANVFSTCLYDAISLAG